MKNYTGRRTGKRRHRTKVIIVAGARPNFMKCAPILSALDKTRSFETLFVHTGQHYDYEMSKVFFKHLRLRKPDIFLNIGSAPRAEQIETVKKRFKKIVQKIHPEIVIVVGDVNSTLGAAIVAKEVGENLAHVEAGLRSFDKSMPEEINRIKTDSLSDILFTTSESACANLIREGIPKEKIYFVGNVMIDTLMNNLKASERSRILARLNLRKKRYYVLTLHRPSNVDNAKTLNGILDTISCIAAEFKVVFPIHPRTQKMLRRFNMLDTVKKNPSFILTRPLGYLDFLKLIKYSRAVFTDSGGIQEETAYLKVPCLTLRANTERPVTVEAGNNIITGNKPDGILKGFNEIVSTLKFRKIKPIKFWDGKAAGRIVKVLLDESKR